MFLNLGFHIHLFFFSSVLCTLQLDYADEPNGSEKNQNGASDCDTPGCNSGFVRVHQYFQDQVVFNYFFPPKGCGRGSESSEEDCDNATTTTSVIPSTSTTIKPAAETRTKKFTVEFDLKRAPLSGLDLYWLMDGTESFNYTRHHLKQQANQLINGIKALKFVGDDYQIGYGTFSDKTGTPRKLVGEGRPRGRPAGERQGLGRVVNVYWTGQQGSHGLYNVLPLTKSIDSKTLQNAISKITSGKTIQSGRAEDILSGLHQVASCPQIGWRENARKIILLTTDQTYYTAGIKKFVGNAQDGNKDTKELVLPFDGKCHLNKNGYFTDIYNKFDYPSVVQVRTPLREKGIIIIFAIGQTGTGDWDIGEKILDIFTEYNKTYAPAISTKPLLYRIDPQKITILDDIIKIIDNAYDKVIKNEVLEVTITPENIRNKVTVNARCITNMGDENEICKVSEEDEKVAYEVEVTLTCPLADDLNIDVNLKGNTDPPLQPIDLRSFCD